MSDQATINMNNLYEEQTVTDMTCGTIRILKPINVADGSPDDSRDVIFVAVASVMAPHGAIPINAPIEGAKTLGEAAMGFRVAVDNAIQDIIQQAQEFARAERSRIITPDEIAGKSGLQLIK